MKKPTLPGEFFQGLTLELSHLYEFSSAGFVMHEKRLRRKGGVIDTDMMMGVFKKPTPDHTNKQTNLLNIAFFQDWTLKLSHLYEFLSAGFVMREKRLRRKGGVIDTNRMMRVCKKPFPDQTVKQAYLTNNQFLETTLPTELISRFNSRIVTLVWVFECWFCDARKTVKKKRWSHWHGQDDGGSYTKAPNNLLPVSLRVSAAVFSPNHYFVLLKQRSILANLGSSLWTIWVFHHSTTGF